MSAKSNAFTSMQGVKMTKRSQITSRQGLSGLLWLVAHRERWHVSELELATLLGVTHETMQDWLVISQCPGNKPLGLPVDAVERIGLLLSLHKSLVLMTPVGNEHLAFEWFRTPIHLWGLNGISLCDFLLEDPRTETLIDLVRCVRSATV